MDSEWVESNHTWGKFNLKKVKGEGKYFRFYLAHRGDRNCEAYEEFIGDPYHSAKQKLNLRASGIYPESCVVAVKTNERRSQYAISFSHEQDRELPKVTWNVLSLKNLKSGEIHSRYNSFVHCYRGRDSKGQCRGWGGDTAFSCRPEVEGLNNPTYSIYRRSMQATANPYLKKKPG